MAKHDSPETLEKLGVKVKFGGAGFVDEHTVTVGGREKAWAARIIICTGSHAINPKIPGLDATGSINHVSLFHLGHLPRRLAVIGGGPIGCEMGQAMSRIGSKVTIIQRAPHLLPREENEIAAMLHEVFAKERIAVMTSAQPALIKKRGSEKLVTVHQDGKSLQVACDEILVATGRRPTIDGLNLAAAGVLTDRHGIKVNDALQTSQKNIYAVGDCAGSPQFTHWAEYEARIATRNALFRGTRKRKLSLMPRVTFTDPEIASVGLTFDEATEANPKTNIHEHKVDFDRLDRAVCEGDPVGLIKVIVDPKEKILGVHIFGMGAGEALAEWVLAMENGIPISGIGRAVHVYPTLCRINRRLADEQFMKHGLSKWITGLFGQYKPQQVG